MIIVKRKWYMIHRAYLWGLNPFGWQEVGTIRIISHEVDEVYVNGYHKPNDGGGGWFAWEAVKK
jgi:hypothetical protein